MAYQDRGSSFSPSQSMPDSCHHAEVVAPVMMLHCMQASDCHKDGDMEQAERLYKKALDLQSQNAEVHHLLGALLIQRYGTGEVRSYLMLRKKNEKMTVRSCQSPKAHRGTALMSLQRF